MSSVATISAVAAIGGSMISANASAKAASGARNAAQNANQMQWDMYQQNRSDQAPWRNTGSAALGALSTGMGINGINNFDWQNYVNDYMRFDPNTGQQNGNITAQDAYTDFMNRFGSTDAGSKYFNQNAPGFGDLSRNFSMADYQADPGYQFRLEQGAKALERAGAARGGQLSGAQLKGLTDYNSGMASQEYGNAYNRFMQNRTTKFGQLSNLAGLGQSSVGQTGQLGANMATNMGNNMMGAANMNAAAGAAGANAWSGALNSLGNTWSNYVQQQQQQANKIG